MQGDVWKPLKVVRKKKKKHNCFALSSHDMPQEHSSNSSVPVSLHGVVSQDPFDLQYLRRLWIEEKVAVKTLKDRIGSYQATFLHHFIKPCCVRKSHPTHDHLASCFCHDVKHFPHLFQSILVP